MATSKDRLPTGKLGRTVSYMLNGKMVTRSIGVSVKKRSKLQLAVMQKTKVTSKFLNPVMPYIKIGYEVIAKLNKEHPQNPAFVYHWKNALKGEYPDIKVDFEKVRLTKGVLPKPEAVLISLVEKGVSFSWNPEIDEECSHWTDQVMMLAYFPESMTAQFVTAGANRHVGSDLLYLTYEKKNALMELYLSFISSSRQSISNSVYAGQLYW
ncbi:DUF6266 family protein [Pedobacter sp. PLR]|uniref:DUF6266 family protein n=1 Tax=Pedobacter sp. PLR TaxID=2994465 RepID=UPI0022455D76|nr:DUF6266 family protein [Pedobacter sp. PLR]MCX2449695.1 DUF6266 family protein [Pedobacter sp. PLR]